jgi:hypothetical protein
MLHRQQTLTVDVCLGVVAPKYLRYDAFGVRVASMVAGICLSCGYLGVYLSGTYGAPVSPNIWWYPHETNHKLHAHGWEQFGGLSWVVDH